MKAETLPLGGIIVLRTSPGERASSQRRMCCCAAGRRVQDPGGGPCDDWHGDDGAEGLGRVKREGGMTIAQSEESCVVYGSRRRRSNEDTPSVWLVWM